MDLGGGSTQIVFEHDEIPAGKHRVDLDFGGFSYVLYQVS
jgi:Golgi nucleoside diphosphatase